MVLRPAAHLTDDEFAARIYKNINNYEYALYGYWGYWKSPGGQTPTGKATFPKLDVYGASVRGQVAEGIGNAEVAFYRSKDDTYGDYKDTQPAAARDRDEFRHVVTLRLTQQLMSQNLTLSLFTFYSPSDEDAYLRPNVQYKATDNLLLEAGANVFFGDHPYTFFDQFENNTSIYGAVRYSF